jgi:hypothetical protein
MTGIESLEKVSEFSTAYLSYNQPIWTHPESLSH